MSNLVNIFVLLSFCVWGVLSQCQQPTTFAVTCLDSSCTGGFLINGVQNATISMSKGNGCTYTFNINTNNNRAFRVYKSSGSLPRQELSSFSNGVVTNGVGTQTYTPENFNNGGMSIGQLYPYSWCGQLGSSCNYGYAQVLAPPPPDVDGGWSAWTTCSVSCGGGTYTRQCNNPAPSGNGADCVGSPDSDIACHTVPCGCRIDVMYVLDGSGSIVPESWTNLKLFVISLSEQVDVGNGSTAGVVQFSTDGKERFETNPRMVNSLDGVVTAIDNMQQIGAYTAIGSGLKLGELGLQTAGRWGYNPPIPKVILLITDGTSNSGEAPTPVSQRVRANGTEIFVIGVGGDFDLEELLSLPSDPVDTHFFNITNYNALNQITNDVAYALCYNRGGSAPASLYLLLLLLLPLAAGLGLFVFIWRRKKPKKVVAPPPEPEPEPAPVVVKAAAPAPVVDKPKDWTVPGTRYIGFGQANIKVKWGADAPPSAPRGHDKYDRWSMMHQGGAIPPSSPSSVAPTTSTPMIASSSAPEPEAAASSSGGCCARFCPCFFVGGAAAANNRSKIAKANNDEEGQWQENTAVQATELTTTKGTS